jgi:hypothetical protein
MCLKHQRRLMHRRVYDTNAGRRMGPGLALHARTPYHCAAEAGGELHSSGWRSTRAFK